MLHPREASGQDLSDGHAQLRESHSAHSSCLTELRDKHQENAKSQSQSPRFGTDQLGK